MEVLVFPDYGCYMLSGPNPLEVFSCLVADFNSDRVNKDIFISSVSDTVTLDQEG